MTYFDWIKKNAENPAIVAVVIASMIVEIQSESLRMLSGTGYPEALRQMSIRSSLSKVVTLLNSQVKGGADEQVKN